MFWFTEKLQNAEIDLKSWDSPHAFHKHVSQVFTNQKVYKDGKLNPFSSHKVGGSRVASGVFGGTFDKPSTCTSQEDADAVLRTTNSPVCQL